MENKIILELTKEELMVLKTFMDFHSDDVEDEYYSTDNYMSMNEKVEALVAVHLDIEGG